MHIVLYRGDSWISRGIQWFTRSVYSHVAISFNDHSEIYEAVDRGWVQAGWLGENHEVGAIVDILEYKKPLTASESKAARECARRMVGAKYDYEAILKGFPLRLGWESKKGAKNFFCSEGVFIACAAMGKERVLLERTHPFKVQPEHINMSPLLKFVETKTL